MVGLWVEREGEDCCGTERAGEKSFFAVGLVRGGQRGSAVMERSAVRTIPRKEGGNAAWGACEPSGIFPFLSVRLPNKAGGRDFRRS